MFHIAPKLVLQTCSSQTMSKFGPRQVVGAMYLSLFDLRFMVASIEQTICQQIARTNAIADDEPFCLDVSRRSLVRKRSATK